MSLSFPSNPTLNQTYTSGTTTWYWDGSDWALSQNNSPTFNNLTVTGTITNTALTNTLSGYVTNTSLTTALNNYALTSSIPSYSVTTATASGTGSLTLSGTTFTYTPPVLPTIPTYTVTTATASGGGSLSLSGTTFTFTPPVLPTVPTYSVTTNPASGGGSLTLSGTTFTFAPAAQYYLPVAVAGTYITGTRGGVIPDGSTITITNGVISAAQYTLPTASTSQLGGVIIDGSTIVISNGGVISTPLAGTVGVANGLATLGSDGKLSASQIPSSLSGAIVYKGTWTPNGSGGTPSLSNGTGTAGWEYAVTTAGTANFGAGNITVNQGDFIIYSGSIWQDIPATTIAAAGTLTGSTLASNVISSSLTSVGTITSGIWHGTAIQNAYIQNPSIVVNGVTLTLGDTNDTIPASANTLTGTTLASNVVTSSLTKVGTLSGLTVTGTTILDSGLTGILKGSSGTITTASVGTDYLTASYISVTTVAASGGGSLTYSNGAFTFAPAVVSGYSLPTASTTTLGGVKIDGTTITISSGVITAVTPSSYSSLTVSTTSTSNSVNVTYNPTTNSGVAYSATGKNTQGGTGYFDFLKAVNTSTGVTNPNKFFRLDVTGTLQVINSAYTTTLLSLTDAGLLTAASGIKTTGTAGIGYATGGGAGSAVTQVGSRTSGVTINYPTGQITLYTASGNTGAYTTFTVTNSTVASTDTILIHCSSSTNLYIPHVTAVTSGSFNISYISISGTSSDSPVFNYTVHKGSAN